MIRVMGGCGLSYRRAEIAAKERKEHRDSLVGSGVYRDGTGKQRKLAKTFSYSP
jgi:hypothetical protein